MADNDRPPSPDDWVIGDHPTANPDGVTTSNVDYWPKSQEEKAELLGVQFATPIDTGDAPYPTGDPADEEDRESMLHRVHAPQELVQGKDMAAQQEANLKAGGSVENSAMLEGLVSQADLQRDEGSPGTQPGGGSVAA